MKAFVGANIIDVKTDSVLPDQVIVTEGPSIVQIAANDQSSTINIQNMDEVYDVSGLTVIPGLIDCHDHLASKNYDSKTNISASV